MNNSTPQKCAHCGREAVYPASIGSELPYSRCASEVCYETLKEDFEHGYYLYRKGHVESPEDDIGPITRPDLIISGGQTGADLGGLVGARRLGISTGGVAPAGYKTEKGNQPEALKAFGLITHPSPLYKDRTLANIQKADATLVFAWNDKSKGTELTFSYCEKEKKPFFLLSALDDADLILARKFLFKYQPKTLNVAGNRESVAPGLCSAVAKFLTQLFSESVST